MKYFYNTLRCIVLKNVSENVFPSVLFVFFCIEMSCALVCTVNCVEFSEVYERSRSPYLPELSRVEYLHVRLFFVDSSETCRGEQTYLHEYIVYAMVYVG